MSHQREAMRGFILHQSNPPCRDVETNSFKPCTLSDQDDLQRLQSVNQHHPAHEHQTRLSCRDGSTNMTCLPLSLKPVEYICGCSKVRSDLNTAIKWSDKWEEEGTVMTRSVCDTQAGWCLDGMFRTSLMYLVKLYAPLDSQINVSSEFGASYLKDKVRMEYKHNHCAWIKHRTDKSPWVRFDFLQSREAIGVEIGKRCDVTDQYVTSFHVSTSDDDVTWSYIGTDVQAVYEGIIATWWFGMEVSARYWRIEPVTFNKYAAMQIELIGYIRP